MSAGATTSIPTGKGSARRIPLSGWRGEVRKDPDAPPAAARCPYCGQVPGPSSTAWCPGFDELLGRAARDLLAG